MNNKTIFTIALVVICLALFGIIYMIFPVFNVLMVCNVLASWIMAGALLSNFLLVGKKENLTVKNAAVMTMVNRFAVVLFLWTVVYTFFFADYKADSCDLKWYFIVDLVILIAAVAAMMMAGGGGAVAEKQNAEEQMKGADKYDLMHRLNAIKGMLLEIEKDPRAEINKSMSLVIDALRALPAGRMSDAEGLTACIDDLEAAVNSGDSDEIKKMIGALKRNINLFK